MPVPRLFTQLSVWSTTHTAEGARLRPTVPDGTKLPRIDVFVTYCGEGLGVVINTARAACAQDYPRSLFRVIVLDDSGSDDLAAAISTHHSNDLPNIHYASRDVPVHTHSKAANLNFGTRFARALPSGPADFFAVLDVDMIPARDWLPTVLPHLLSDPRAGLACPFQRLYNIPPGDPLGMGHDISTIESLTHLQDTRDGSFCTGSGFVVRRAALEAVGGGGFPEDSLQEDVLTSLALAAAGWRTVYVPGCLQWGLAASTFADWVRQRQRWAAGILSVARHLASARARDLPVAVRLGGALWGAIDGSASFVWTATMFVLPLLILSGRPLLPPPTPSSHLPVLFRLAVLDFVAQSAYQALLCSLVGWRMSLLAPVSALYTAPYRLAITLRCFLAPKLLGRAVPRFTPTGIDAALGKAERDARRKGRGLVRIVLWECGGWMYVVVLWACLAGAGVSVKRALRDGEDRVGRRLLEGLVVRFAWPPLFLLWLVVVKNAWTPVRYAIAPPPFVEREQLLERRGREGEGDQGVAYPKREVWERHMERHSQAFWLVVAALFAGELLVFEGWLGCFKSKRLSGAA